MGQLGFGFRDSVGGFSRAVLGGPWVVINGVISKVSILIPHIRGLVTPLTTPEPPSKARKVGSGTWGLPPKLGSLRLRAEGHRITEALSPLGGGRGVPQGSEFNGLGVEVVRHEISQVRLQSPQHQYVARFASSQRRSCWGLSESSLRSLFRLLCVCLGKLAWASFSVESAGKDMRISDAALHVRICLYYTHVRIHTFHVFTHAHPTSIH